ncbi:hypothetical protein ACSA002_1880 [Salmonella phage vB_SalM_SA002]|nr:hypothetical protein ACSA002_1880 [Salmonella phage vB_SalM_SA002]
MTTPSRPDRLTSGLEASKVATFLRGGGKAKLGKAVSEHRIEFGGDLDKVEGELVVAVPRYGVNQSYWYTTALSTLKGHIEVKIDGTTVSLA